MASGQSARSREPEALVRCALCAVCERALAQCFCGLPHSACFDCRFQPLQSRPAFCAPPQSKRVERIPLRATPREPIHTAECSGPSLLLCACVRRSCAQMTAKGAHERDGERRRETERNLTSAATFCAIKMARECKLNGRSQQSGTVCWSHDCAQCATLCARKRASKQLLRLLWRCCTAHCASSGGAPIKAAAAAGCAVALVVVVLPATAVQRAAAGWLAGGKASAKVSAAAAAASLLLSCLFAERLHRIAFFPSFIES